jgi:sugar lactone lactonase YvrE
MKKSIRFCCALLLPLALTAVTLAGCGDDDATQPTELTVETLVTNLQYPQGLWPFGGSLYLTETAGRSTAFGGNVRLSRYDRATDELVLLLDNPENPDAVVVAADGTIYLSAWQGSIPGESGSVSYVDPGSLVESPVTGLKIAASDMYLDSNGDIYVAGASADPGAASLYRLPAGNFADTVVVKRGLGRVAALSKIGPNLYYSNLEGIHRLDSSGTSTRLVQQTGVISLTSDGEHLYYAEVLAGQIARLDLQTLAVDTIVTQLASPTAVRYQASISSLFFLEGGTAESEFKDGALKVVSGLAGSP